ncbi:MAG: ankyrin repeat domain-containing protein, partial [Sulfobacillus sp.]
MNITDSMSENVQVIEEAFAIDELLAAILSRCESDGNQAAKLGLFWVFLGNPKVRYTRYTMDYAAAYGHLPIVEFLHQNRTEGCTKDAMDRAAANGHLPIVKFLHQNRSEGCTKDAMDCAAANGHLPIVEFLHQNRTEGCTKDAMDRTAANGHLP